jgi:Zn-finger nucleic acid-binding protein
MMKKTVKDAMEVELCPKCNGLWVSAEEAEEILRRQPRTISDANKLEKVSLPDGRKVRCPACYGDIMRARNLVNKDISVEQCLMCYGFWLDAAEIQNLKEKGLITDLKEFFSRLW